MPTGIGWTRATQTTTSIKTAQDRESHSTSMTVGPAGQHITFGPTPQWLTTSKTTNIFFSFLWTFRFALYRKSGGQGPTGARPATAEPTAAVGWGFWQVPLGRIGPSVASSPLIPAQGRAESDGAVLSSGFAGPVAPPAAVCATAAHGDFFCRPLFQRLASIKSQQLSPRKEETL